MKRMILVSFVLALVCLVSFGQPTWTSLTTLNPSNLQSRSVEYLPNGVVWIQGGNIADNTKNYLHVSTDHGSSWVTRTIVNNGAGASWLSNVSAIDANTAIVGTLSGEILRTTNGGVKWDTVLVQYDPSGFMDGVKYLNQDTAIAFGDGDASGVFIGRSTDGGATWVRVTSIPDSSKRLGVYGYVTYGQAMDVYNNTVWCAEYWGAGKRPFILKSTDAGVTWTDFPIALPGGPQYDYYLQSINFKDDNTGLGVIRRVTSSSATGNYLVKTTDGGATWSDTISVAPGISHDSAKVMAAKWIRGTSTVIASGYAGNWPKAWKSTDDGATWASLDAPPTASGADLRCVSFISLTQGFATGYMAAFKLTLATGISNPRNDGPSGYSLDQNFPNPFNPSTTIPYTLAKAGNVQIKVVDLLGRTVATLVDGHQSAGPHTVSFNATTLSSGVYFYSIKSGEFSKTKSLLLLK